MRAAHFLAHRARYAALLVLAVLILLVMPFTPSGNSWLADALWNAAHAPLFGSVCFLCLWLFRESGDRPRRIAVAGLCLVALVSEVAQQFTGRNSSGHDLFNDMLGITLGFAAWTLMSRPRDAAAARSSAGLAAVILAAGGLAIAPLLIALEAGVERELRFPVLFDPASSGALDMTRSLGPRRGAELAIDGNGLAVRLRSGPLPGVSISGFPPDWRSYSRFVIDVENPGDDELRLETHVADRGSNFGYYDRFNARLDIPPHMRRTFTYALADIESAPKTRRTRLDEMATIAIYRIEGAGNEFVLRSIRLE